MSPPTPYELLDELGRGASAIVYRARQTGLDRMVALKVVQVSSATIDHVELRLKREGKTLSRARHPNLIEVFDFGEIDGRPYIAMELIEGSTLRDFLAVDPGKVQERADTIFEAILGAIEALHEVDLVHRDLKPANIMLSTGGRPVVMDLGLVKDLAGGTVATEAGAIVGTPMFMAPEVLLGGSATKAADVWGLGCLYFSLHSGRPLFTQPSLGEILDAVVRRPLPDFSQTCPGLSPDRREVLSRMLERDLTRRPPDAPAVRALWENAKSAGRSEQRRPPTPSGKSGRIKPVTAKPTSRPGAAAGLVAAAVALLLVGGRLVTSNAPSRTSEPSTTASIGASLNLPSPRPHGSALGSADLLPPPSPLPPSWRWRLVEHHRAALAAGGESARRLARELTRARTAPVGRAPEMWVRWIDLGRWLESRSPGPWRTRTLGLEMRAVESDMLLGPILAGILQRPPMELLELSLSGIYSHEQNAFGWLMLGYYLEKEHPASLPKARISYAQGLRAPWPVSWGLKREELWIALTRALEVTPGHDLAKEWWARVPDANLLASPWKGLFTALPPDDPRLTKLVRDVPPRVHDIESQQIALVHWLRTDLWSPTRARALLDTLVGARPDFRELKSFLIVDDLISGNAGAARTASEADGQRRRSPLVDYCERGAPSVDFELPNPDSGFYETLLRVRVDQLLERGDVAAAVRLLEATRAREADKASLVHVRAAMSVLGCSASSATLEAEVLRALRSGLDSGRRLDLCGHLAGALSPVRAHPTMLRLLEDVRGPRALTRALWDSRRGVHATSLIPLEPPEDVSGINPVYQAMAFEIHTRPLLDAARGKSVPGQVVSYLQSFPRPWTIWPLVKFLEAIRTRHWDAAAVEADTLTRADPRSPYWPLALGWTTRLASPQGDHRALDARVRAALRARGAHWALSQVP